MTWLCPWCIFHKDYLRESDLCSFKMASVFKSYCSGCKWEEYELVSVAYHNEERAQHIFREHGVLPSSVTCVLCDKECTFYEYRGLWRCTNSTKVPKRKKRHTCSFSIADQTGTFLENNQLDKWQVLLFINLFVQKRWSHSSATRNLGITQQTSVSWRHFCSEVCLKWLDHQEPIGGCGKIVEIGTTLFPSKNDKFEQDSKVSSVWLLGGIERDSNKKFAVALPEPLSTGEQGHDLDGGILIPLIVKHVMPGTIIHTNNSLAYRCLTEAGFHHYTADHKEKFVSPIDKEVRMQKIKRLWRDIKEWCARPGNKVEYIHQYLGRYIFLNSVPSEERVHHFLKAAMKVYPEISQQSNNSV